MKLVNWLGKLIVRPLETKKKKRTRPEGDGFFDMAEEELLHIFKHGSCPYCHGDLFEGPQGGMNINLYCGNASCASAFNVCDPSFGFIPFGQFIGRPPEHFLEMRRLDVTASD